jgi:tetratricopeptide (TPR) repeat protein/DNA-binding winged helix-turn-helix (wHTH) protein
VRQPLSGGFFLGEHHVDPASGMVRGQGPPTRLHPAAIDVLLCLARQPEEIVSREELLASVSGDRDHGSASILTQAVRELRRALGDDPDDPVFIQTLRGRGYRLLIEPAATPQPRRPARALLRNADLIGELNRRGVLETAVAYLVVGWLLIQVADVTFMQFGLPEWAPRFVTLLVIAGFPVALGLAWFIEFTGGRAMIDPGPGRRARQRTFSRQYIAVVGALLLASAGVYSYDHFIGLPGTLSQSEASAARLSRAETVDGGSIAVLPFLNIDGSEVTRVFSDGLAEDVIDRLSVVPGLRVSARGDSFTLPPDAASPDVRNRLRVAYYVAGSVRISEQALRVVIRLIDSARGTQIVSRTFERELSDFFELQEEITRLIVANLRVALPSTGPMPAFAGSSAFDAYVQYRRGMEILYRPVSEQSLEDALEAFGASLREDSDYAAAHAGVCLTHTAGYQVTRDARQITEAEQACGTALRLNPNLLVVHDALGDLYHSTGRYEDAERAYEAAIALNPNDVRALTGLAGVYLSQQRMEESEARYRQAVGLQPGDWNTYNALGRFLYSSGRYEEAVGAYAEVVAVDPGNINGWTNLASALMLSGSFADAAAAFERAIALEPRPTTYANLGLLHYYLGEFDEAVEALDTAVTMAPSDYLTWSNFGDALSVSGQEERANFAFTRAEALAREQLLINPRSAEISIDLAWISAMLGQFDEAERLAAWATEVAAADPAVHYIKALVLTKMNRHAEALDRLEEAVALGYSPAVIRAEPHLAPLRPEARFTRLTAP